MVKFLELKTKFLVEPVNEDGRKIYFPLDQIKKV